MKEPRQSGQRTLLRLALILVAGLGVLAAADVWRGQGGRAWLFGQHAVATESESAGGGAVVATTLFRDVRVFDGDSYRESIDVLVRDGLIAQVAADIEPPAGAEIIDGDGMTLLPALIDAHVHAFGPVLEPALMMGIGTELDMFTIPAAVAALKAEQERGEGLGRADLFSAGYLVTAPGGHGTEYGFEIPTLTSPEDADAFVQARVDEGSDYIKIVLDGGSLSRNFNTLDLPTIAAVIEAAHARGKLAVVHVARLEDARAVVEAGADGIVHVFYDQPATDEIVEVIRSAGAFVVPTLAVLESVAGLDGGSELVADPRLEPFLGPAEITSLTSGFPPGPGRAAILANGLASVAALHAAGVPVLAGTDAPNPGTAHGASLHRELELLVRAGLTPEAALHAATAATADAFGLDDRGRIAEGRRADLLLVRGSPIEKITATRDIVGVWKAGTRADRAAFRDSVAAARAGGAAPTGVKDGLIAGFEDGEVSSEFGAGWMVSTDSMIGGRSIGEMKVVDGGARDSAKALEVTGNIVPGGIAVWAGAMFFPGGQQFAPADLSAKSGLSFWAKGDGATHVVMLFAQSLGQQPALQQFTPGPEWERFDFSFDDFPGVDPNGLQGLLFSGAGDGEFSFLLDDIRFQ